MSSHPEKSSAIRAMRMRPRLLLQYLLFPSLPFRAGSLHVAQLKKSRPELPWARCPGDPLAGGNALWAGHLCLPAVPDRVRSLSPGLQFLAGAGVSRQAERRRRGRLAERMGAFPRAAPRFPFGSAPPPRGGETPVGDRAG